MQYITNARGTRAFHRKTGKVVTLAVAAGALLSGTIPSFAQPTGQAPLRGKAVRVLQETGRAQDVTLDFVAADINDVLKALAVQTHTNIVSGSDVKGNVTVSLAHVSLDEALNMVSHLSGYQYAKVGRSYVVGSPATIAAMTAGDAAAALPTTAVLTFNYSDPASLTTTITDRYPGVKVSAGKATGQGGRSVLIVTGTDSDVTAVKQLVADTEAGLSNGIAESQTVVYDIKYASADDLQTVLGRLVPNLIVTPGPTQRTAPVAPATADAGGTTSVTTSYGATTQGATVTAVTGSLPTKPTTSSLLLTGSDTDIARARQILATVDVRPAQINFEAKITDLDTNLARDLGLGYSFAGAQTTVGQVTSAGANPSTAQFRTSLPIGYTPLSQFVNVQLYALQTKGDARILATPNISAIDGQPAAIFIGNNITYVSSITSSPTGQNVTTATVSAGVKLFITGKVNNDGYVTINLHPEVSTYTLTATTGGAQLPNIATREATTTLRVRDGDIIALGGLAQNSEAKTSNQVPLLSDIPILGNLFRRDTTSRERRELVIFIRVSIAKDQA
ncbi:MAG: type II secretion system protein GspD [Armatimonadetes bacterium]|nr:type II secretion system protein GspD [Armatimonadota bacterium]